MPRGGCRVAYRRRRLADSQTAMDEHRYSGVWGAAMEIRGGLAATKRTRWKGGVSSPHLAREKTPNASACQLRTRCEWIAAIKRCAVADEWQPTTALHFANSTKVKHSFRLRSSSLARPVFCLPCGRAVALQPPSLPSSTSSHLILVPLARPALGSVTSKRNCIYCISRMQLPFRRAIDVVLSPEQGMQAGPMPVAPRVVSDIPYVMLQGSGLTGDDVGASQRTEVPPIPDTYCTRVCAGTAWSRHGY